MRAILTRVTSARVTVAGDVVGAIDCPETGGILALIGIAAADAPPATTEAELTRKIDKMAEKIAGLRILHGERSAAEANAPVLLVSQFTLYGRTAKGRRPSWSDAASGEVAEPIIARISERLCELGIHVEHGQFGAMMQVMSVNDGPFTVLVET